MGYAGFCQGGSRSAFVRGQHGLVGGFASATNDRANDVGDEAGCDKVLVFHNCRTICVTFGGGGVANFPALLGQSIAI